MVTTKPLWATESVGTFHFQDRHATGHSTPKIDSRQDYEPISLQEDSGKTIMKFKRKFETCDSEDIRVAVCVFVFMIKSLEK